VSDQPYRRAPGTVDPGADYARQSDKRARGLDKRVTALEQDDVFDLPHSQLVVGCNVPNDSATHYFPHSLGRAYKAASIVGYGQVTGQVISVAPEIVTLAGHDPTTEFGLYAFNSTGDSVVNVWLF
jgi:hypothetical protein